MRVFLNATASLYKELLHETVPAYRLVFSNFLVLREG